MAQKILLRRGGLANLNSGATIGVTRGEQLFASGTLANSDIENITFIANADGNGTFQAVGRLFTGTADASGFDSKLNGLPYYKTDEEALYRLGDATPLDLTGNLEGNTVAAMTVTTLTGTTIDLSGDITGSNLLLSGDATIDGDITLGGNITIGDANTDNISLGGEITSNIIPDADDTYALGSASRRWNIYGVDSVLSGSFSGSFQGNFVGGMFDIAGAGQGSGTDTINANDTITFTNASNHGFHFTITDNQVSLVTPQSLKTTASPTFASATLGNVQIGQATEETITTTTGDLIIDSAGGTTTIDDNAAVTGTLTVTGATDLNSTLSVSGDVTLDGASAQNITKTGGNLNIGASNGNTVIESTVFNGNDVTIPGNLTVSGTTTTIDSTEVNIGDNIITLNAAGTVADGGVQVIDTTGTAGTGSILWNATNDYWYAGISGSTHYRLSTFTNATPTTNAIPKIDANKRLVASNIADTGTQIDLSVDLDMNSNDILNVGTLGITGLDASSFVHTDASKNISTVTPSVAGDLFQWNGTAFVASNVIDGGTF